MGMFKEVLEKKHGYDARERANIYLGIALGVTTPIVVTRYLLFPLDPKYGVIGESLAWAFSVGMDMGSSFLMGGFPLLHSFAAGIGLGFVSAEQLKKQRKAASTVALESLAIPVL